MARERVVITGVGAVSPVGLTAQESWASVLAGRPGIGPITLFDASEYPVTFACEVKDFDPSVWIDHKQARRMDRFAQLIVAAARQAEQDSGLDVAAEADRVGAAIATGIGGLTSFQDCHDTLRDRGAEFLTPPVDWGGEIRAFFRDPDGHLIEISQAGSAGVLSSKEEE